MKKALFYTFLFVFASTALITLLGIIRIIEIDKEYLSKLFYALIVESIAPVIALFKKTEFFDKSVEKNSMNIVLLPKESFGRDGDPHSCTISAYDKESDKEREIRIQLKRENGYLCAYLTEMRENELIKVHVQNAKTENWESQYFSPSIAKAEMEKI